MLWHLQTFAAIWSPWMESQWKEIPIDMNYDVNVVNEMGDALLWLPTSWFYPQPFRLLQWHETNNMDAEIAVKQPWKIWINVEDVLIYL